MIKLLVSVISVLNSTNAFAECRPFTNARSQTTYQICATRIGSELSDISAKGYHLAPTNYNANAVCLAFGYSYFSKKKKIKIGKSGASLYLKTDEVGVTEGVFGVRILGKVVCN